MSQRAVHAFVVILVLTPLAIAAECFVLTGKYVMAQKNIALVFSGQVVEVARTGDLGYRVTFAVDRVWKGSVPKRFDLYVWDHWAEMPRYEKDRRYVVLAKRLTEPREREGVGLSGTQTLAFAAINCGGVLSPQIERELGRGHAPEGAMAGDR